MNGAANTPGDKDVEPTDEEFRAWYGPNAKRPSPSGSVEGLVERAVREAHFHRRHPFEVLNHDLAADLLEGLVEALKRMEQERDIARDERNKARQLYIETWERFETAATEVSRLSLEVGRLTSLVERAYNEGFNEGMNEVYRHSGGKPWRESIARNALAGGAEK